MNAVSMPDALLRRIERSHLLDAAQLAPYADRLRRDGAAFTRESLVAQLQRDGLLTPYQGRQLLQGQSRSFFLTDKYKILDLVGEGGMGRVFLCEHLLLEKLVAVKVLTLGDEPIPGAVERFLREVRAAAALDDPNIARTYDADYATEGPFLVMEYVDGTNLHQLVALRGPLDPIRAAQYVRQAALGLQHAHERGLIHRDVKPGNLMVDRTGTIKLLDLGLARFFDPRRNQDLTRRFDAKTVLGTADFIAPEQAMNSSVVDTRADIYALGCTFYFLLLARFPFADGSPADKLQLHVAAEFDPVEGHRPGVPGGLLAVLRKMVRKDPNERYATPGEVAEALAPWAARRVPPPTPEELPPLARLNFPLGLCPAPSPAWLVARTGTGDATPLPGVLARRPDPDEPLAANALTPAGPLTAELMALSAGRTVPVPAPRHRPAIVRRLAALTVLLVAAAAGFAFAEWGRRRDRAGTPPPVVALKASGSTLAQPLFERWGREYAKVAPLTLEYAGTGSTRGIAAMVEGVTDFGGTDVPLSAAQVRSAANVRGEVLHVPVAVGAVAVAYNLPGVTKPVRFSGPILAAMSLGKIATWDDPALVQLNPGVPLPSLPVTVVRRSDGSGTTYLWTDYLSAVSVEWRTRVGTTAEPDWPATRFLPARGNDGVAREVKRTPGALGYLDLNAALAHGVTVGAIKNRHGGEVRPSVATVRAALDSYGSDLPADLRASLIDRPGRESYPIVGATWVVVYEHQPAGKADALRCFLRWVVTDGQVYAEELNSPGIPAALRPGLDDSIGRITDDLDP